MRGGNGSFYEILLHGSVCTFVCVSVVFTKEIKNTRKNPVQ